MKTLYKILLGVLTIGITLGFIGSLMNSTGNLVVGFPLFMIGFMLIVMSIVGIRVYYIRSDPVRFAEFKRRQEQERQEKARQTRIYNDERTRARARSDHYDERRRGW